MVVASKQVYIIFWSLDGSSFCQGRGWGMRHWLSDAENTKNYTNYILLKLCHVHQWFSVVVFFSRFLDPDFTLDINTAIIVYNIKAYCLLIKMTDWQENSSKLHSKQLKNLLYTFKPKILLLLKKKVIKCYVSHIFWQIYGIQK